MQRTRGFHQCFEFGTVITTHCWLSALYQRMQDKNIELNASMNIKQSKSDLNFFTKQKIHSGCLILILFIDQSLCFPFKSKSLLKGIKCEHILLKLLVKYFPSRIFGRLQRVLNPCSCFHKADTIRRITINKVVKNAC